MKGFLKFLAFIFALLLVITTPLALFTFDLGRVVFNQPRVQRLVSEEVVQSDLIPIALEWFSDRRAGQRVEAGEALTGSDAPDIVLLMSYLDRNDWRQIKQEVLPDYILEELARVTVSGAYAWIDTADRLPQITWDLQPLKDRINTEHGVNAILIAYNKLPPCTEEQIADFVARLAAAPDGKEALYNLCQFPDPYYEDQLNDYISSLAKVVENVPTQFALTDELARTADPAQGVGPAALKTQLRLIRLLLRWAWALPVGLALLIILCVVGSRAALGRWLGVPLTIAGVLALPLPLVYRPLLSWYLMAGPLSETPPIIREEALRVLLKILAAVFQPMLIQALVIIVVGLLLVIVPHLVKRKK